MPPRKRPVSQIDAKKHAAKVAAADAHTMPGRAPAGLDELAANLTSLTPLDMLKHEDAWRNIANALNTACIHVRRSAAAAAALRVIVAEQAAYGIDAAQPITCIDATTRLLAYSDKDGNPYDNNDAKIFDSLDTPSYCHNCACCDDMHDMYRVEQKWRVVGSTLFVCRACHDRIRRGGSLAIVNPDTVAPRQSKTAPP